MKYSILLDNIRSLHNVGSIFRTADGAWFEKIFLTGYTPTPPRKEIAKTALWAEKSVLWEYYEDPREIISTLKKEGTLIISIEQATSSTGNIQKYLEDNSKNICIIMGNEINGVSKDLLDLSDIVFELPMQGIKQSLNVSVTAGIVMYYIWYFARQKNWEIS